MFEHQRYEQLGHLPGQVLLDVARNESAPRLWRKAAVEIMLEKRYPQSAHPELASFVAEIKAEKEAKDEVESVVESAIEQQVPEFHEEFHEPMTAGVTSDSLLRDDVIDNEPPSDED